MFIKKRKLTSTNCSICNKQVASAYCGECGQKIPLRITTIPTLIADFFSNFFNVERSGLATILKILWNPKTVVENYYLGYRNYFASPGKIFLYSLAAIALHVTFVEKTVLGISLSIEDVAVQYVFWILFFPLLTLASILTFVRSKHKLIYHIISIVYVAGALMVVMLLISDLIGLFLKDELSVYPFFVFLLLTLLLNAKIMLGPSSKLKLTLYVFVQLIVFLAIGAALVLIINGLNLIL